MANRTSGRTRPAQRATRAGRTAGLPWVKTFGQVGVAAIGIVYLLLAWISLQVAFGGSSKSADNSGAFGEIADQPYGQVLLGGLAIGLLAYAVWQFVLATVGIRENDGAKENFERLSAVAKGIFGAALGSQALKLAISGSGKSSSQSQADWTAKLLGAPAGRALVVLIGLAVIALAGYLIYRGVEKKFLDKLERRISKNLTRLGQFGWIARGVAFGVLGGLVVVAGVKSQPQKSRGLDQALKTLADAPYGKWILSLVALGFAAYGVFQLITARIHKKG